MRPDKVVFIDESLENCFNSLRDGDPIKKGITKAILELRENCFAGRNVKKNLIPRELIEKYGIDNLWIYNLPSAWRLFYSLTSGGEVDLIAAILDWMDHKDYERLFGF
ncbi:MAG: hypothetical protein KJ592_00605 [Nanoarchaeota archaeon]|nr:hypothetical protein [Nanoarchaeota archaeon]